jgi:hypothetical protein
MDVNDIPSQDRAHWARAYLENHDGIKSSEFFLMLCPDKPLESALQAMQLGVAILMDKPIIVLADQLDKIPKSLRKIAVVVETYDKNSPGKAAKVIEHALGRARVLVAKLPKDEHGGTRL